MRWPFLACSWAIQERLDFFVPRGGQQWKKLLGEAARVQPQGFPPPAVSLPSTGAFWMPEKFGVGGRRADWDSGY